MQRWDEIQSIFLLGIFNMYLANEKLVKVKYEFKNCLENLCEENINEFFQL